jgi:hypothetical protein
MPSRLGEGVAERQARPLQFILIVGGQQLGDATPLTPRLGNDVPRCLLRGYELAAIGCLSYPALPRPPPLGAAFVRESLFPMSCLGKASLMYLPTPGSVKSQSAKYWAPPASGDSGAFQGSWRGITDLMYS